jgi:hypothetical protein
MGWVGQARAAGREIARLATELSSEQVRPGAAERLKGEGLNGKGKGIMADELGLRAEG